MPRYLFNRGPIGAGTLITDDAGHQVAVMYSSKYNPHAEADALLFTRAPDLLKTLHAMVGYMTNAVIDLQTGTKKQTTIDTLSGGIKLAKDVIALAEGN